MTLRKFVSLESVKSKKLNLQLKMKINVGLRSQETNRKNAAWILYL